MKKRHLFFCYWLTLSLTITLCGCSQPPAPAESEPASGQETDGSENPRETADAERIQAEFDAFTERLFQESLAEDPLSTHFMVQHPENYGIEIPSMQFPEISAEILREDAAENEELQQELLSFDTELLTPDQLLTFQMLQDTLDTEQRCEGLELFYQPLSPLVGIQAQLPVLLAEYTFSEQEDVDRYLELLSQIDTYYEQLAAFERERAAAGLALSDSTLDRVIQSCKDYLIRPENCFLTETFQSRLDGIPGLTAEERSAYEERHLTILKEDFIPAYTSLSGTLEELKGQGTNQGGLCGYEGGREYYSYLVASLTGTGSTVEELRSRIEKQLGSDIGEITLLVQNRPELEYQLDDSGISLSGPTEILDHLQEQIKEDFPLLTNAEYQVKYVPEALSSSLSPAFFLVPPLDSEDINTIYINEEASRQQNLYTMLAHEGYPGHLYQSVYFNRKNQCPLRRLLTCDGYNEGWGLYSELYSYSFDNGLEAAAQKLMTHSEASIYGLYALLDIHVNYDGWDLEKTARFLEDIYGIRDPEVAEEIYQSLIDNPCNYLKYYTGYLELCTMQTAAQEALGDRYTAKAFHQFILDMDGASFRVIEPYFQAWLQACEAASDAE